MIQPGLNDDQPDLRQLLIHHRRKSPHRGARVYGELRVFHRVHLDPLAKLQIGDHQLRSPEDHRVGGALCAFLSGDLSKGQTLLCEKVSPQGLHIVHVIADRLIHGGGVISLSGETHKIGDLPLGQSLPPLKPHLCQLMGPGALGGVTGARVPDPLAHGDRSGAPDPPVRR